MKRSKASLLFSQLAFFLLLTQLLHVGRKQEEPARYQGRPTAYWRALMEWPLISSGTLAYLYPLCLYPNPDAVSVILELLRDDSLKVQYTALTCLWRSKPRPRKVLPTLCHLLDRHIQANHQKMDSDGPPWISELDLVRLTTEVLADMQSDASVAIPRLRRLLTHSTPYLRLSAAKAVWAITNKDESSRKVVVQVINSPTCSLDDRCYAVEVLGSMHPPSEDILNLLNAILLRDPAARMRRGAAMALGEFGTAAVSVVPTLVNRLKDGDADVRCEVIKAILSITHHPDLVLPHLVRELKDDDINLGYFEILKGLNPVPPEILAGLEDFIKRHGVADWGVDSAKDIMESLRRK